MRGSSDTTGSLISGYSRPTGSVLSRSSTAWAEIVRLTFRCRATAVTCSRVFICLPLRTKKQGQSLLADASLHGLLCATAGYIIRGVSEGLTVRGVDGVARLESNIADVTVSVTREGMAQVLFLFSAAVGSSRGVTGAISTVAFSVLQVLRVFSTLHGSPLKRIVL